jgi:thymidylate synthase
MIHVNSEWRRLVTQTLKFGEHRLPRGNQCLSLFNQSSEISMIDPIFSLLERKINYRFMFAEARMILTGSNQTSFIEPYCKNILKFSDDGFVFQGAYGPKVTEQIRYIVDVLTKDRHTRQAVINIWRENPRESKDIPCTLSMQFIVTNNDLLNMHVTMRSNDLWLGFPYDVFNFSMIAHFVSSMLYFHPPPTTLYLNVADQHIYDRDIQNLFNYSTWKDKSTNIKIPTTPRGILDWLTETEI